MSVGYIMDVSLQNYLWDIAGKKTFCNASIFRLVSLEKSASRILSSYQTRRLTHIHTYIYRNIYIYVYIYIKNQTCRWRQAEASPPIFTRTAFNAVSRLKMAPVSSGVIPVPRLQFGEDGDGNTTTGDGNTDTDWVFLRTISARFFSPSSPSFSICSCSTDRTNF